MATAGREGWGAPEVALLLGTLAVGALDLFLLGLAAAFGPTGFGGDRTPTSRELALAAAEQVVGWTGCALTVVALVSLMSLKRARTRRRTAAAVLAVQLAATVALVVMISS